MSLASAQFVKAEGLVGPNPRRNKNNRNNDRRDDNRDSRIDRSDRRERDINRDRSSRFSGYGNAQLERTTPRLWTDPAEDPAKEEKNNRPKERVYRQEDNRNAEPAEKKIRHQEEKNILDTFKKEYIAHKTDTRWLTDYLVEQIPAVCNITKHYLETKWDDISASANGVLSLMSTKQFAEVLALALQRNEIEDWDNCWNDLAVTISILLTTSSNQMKEETLMMYVQEIIPSGSLWGREVGDMQDKFGITKEMAIELVIKIPWVEFTNVQIGLCYNGVREAVLAHADENCEVLDANIQKEIFKYFFGTGDTCLKVLGRNLADEKLDADEGIPETLMKEYDKMLYELLDSFDINQIKYVLRYVTAEKKKLVESNSDKKTLFNSEAALEYNSIAKAVNSLIAENEDANQYLI